MTTRTQILATAASQLGYTERGNNVTKYWADLKPDFQHQPWCAAFVNWVLKRSGITALLTGPSAPYYTPSMEAWAKKVGRWKASKDCKPGDVLIFGNGHATHTGFLERQDGAYVITLEGNTSSGNSGSQANGGGVYRRRRPRSWVRGCISLEGLIDGKLPPLKLTLPLTVDGEMGAQTRAALAKYLRRPADGSWDRDDVREVQTWLGRARTGRINSGDVRALQLKVGAKVDGAWGANTTRGLQAWLNKRHQEGKL